jgi:hypothetical protein
MLAFVLGGRGAQPPEKSGFDEKSLDRSTLKNVALNVRLLLYVAGSPPDEDLIFKPLAKHDYKISTVIPAENVFERFFNIGGFLFDSGRYNLSNASLKTICMNYLWEKVFDW